MAPPEVVDAAWLRQVCLDAGADDLAVVPDDAVPEAGDRRAIDGAPGAARSLIVVAVRSTGPDPAPLDAVARRIARALQLVGVRAAPARPGVVPPRGGAGPQTLVGTVVCEAGVSEYDLVPSDLDLDLDRSPVDHGLRRHPGAA